MKALLGRRTNGLAAGPGDAPLDARAAWEMLRQARTVSVPASRSAQGAALRAHLAERVAWLLPSRRVLQAYLELPRDPALLLRGRSMQAQRTNITKARAAGLSVRLAEGGERGVLVDHFRAVVPGMEEWSQDLDTSGRDTWWVAEDREGRPLGFASATVDVRAALLRCAVTDPDADAGLRYLLHSEVARDLIDRGCTLLLVRGRHPLRLAPGLRYFQERLGYRIGNLRLEELR